MGNEYKEQQSIDDMSKALINAQRTIARLKNRNDEVVAAVYQAAKDAALTNKPSGVIKAPAKQKSSKRPEVALLHTTDWQLGKRTEGYSIDILKQRLSDLAAKAIEITELQRSARPVNEITILLGGDMVEGLTVFPGQAWEVEAHLFEQLFTTSSLIEELVLTMLGQFQKVNVVCEYGNHGRIGRRGDVPGSDNIDRMAYRVARDRLSNQTRLTWQDSADWYQIAEIGNYKALLVHGDEIKSFGGNTPAFGILRKCNAWATGVVPPFHDVFMGHFHTPMTLTLANGGRVFVTGSPESENVYAAEFVAAKGKPSQRLHFVDPEKARTTAEYMLWLD